ncbi:MAG: DUF6512 family protein [Oscillospiraceae bacterium]|jgi:hypothetical protein
METKFWHFELTGFIFTVILGSFLHFLYSWSGKNKIVGLFSAVSESTWEHLKLLFFPVLIFSVVEYFFIKGDAEGFFLTKAVAVLLGMGFIVAAFYTYSGILGFNVLFVDILLFVVGAAITAWFSNSYIAQPFGNNTAGLVILIALAITVR